MQRDSTPIASDDITRFNREPADFHLHSLQRGVYAAASAPRGRLFRKYIPWFECLTQLEFNAVGSDGTDPRKAECHVWLKPLVLEVVSSLAQVVQNLKKIALHEMREHKSVMKGRTPAQQIAGERLIPECTNQHSHQQHLEQPHPVMGSHFKRT